MAGVGGCANGTGGACTVREIADLPVLNRHRSPIVSATVDGHAVAFFVDTGTGLSAIGRDAADRLGLTIDPRTRFVMEGIGGEAVAPAAIVHRLDLGGGAAARDVRFAATGPFHGAIGGTPLIGVFGGDFLASHDVEFDLPARRVRVFDESDCPENFTPYDGAVDAIPFRRRANDTIGITLRLDDHSVDAILDSGASGTLVDSGDVGDAGEPVGDRSAAVFGIAGTPETVHFRRFATRSVGPVTDGPVVVAVGDAPMTLLGADWLRTHTVWISYPHDTLFVPRAASAR